MAWTNADYQSPATAQARLAKATAFHAELLNAIGSEVASDGTSVSQNNITQLIAMVNKDLPRLREEAAAEAARARNGGRSLVSFA
jgi:hypothetical protein